ncbi:MAG: hypothetical protein R3B09_03130 [Nannocystaceae bacterium]
MTSRPHRTLLALLGLCISACGPSPRGSSTPPAGGGAAPAAPPAAAIAEVEPRPEDLEMIAIDAFAGQVCGLTRSGALFCWGYAMVPGEVERREVSRPTRLPGVPRLAGFEMVNGGIVGWDARGDAIAITDGLGKGFEVHQGLFLAKRLSIGAWGAELRRVRVKAVSRRCLLTHEGRLLCNGPASQGAHYRDQFPGTYAALGTGRFACAVDASGLAVAINASDDPLEEALARGKAMAPYEVRPIPGLPRGPTSLACNYGSPRGEAQGSKDQRPLACAVGGDRRLSCTDPALEAALVRAAEGAPIRSVFADEHFCVLRDDGQARCVATGYYPDPGLLPPLAGLDASRGLALDVQAICALGRDGTPRCWGEAQVPQLGIGATIALASPVHVEGFDGALEVSHSGGITCARHSADRVRCFGRFGSTVVEPRALKLPEPVDRIEGGAPLCARGAASKRWYCRDPFQSFFGGSLPDHFASLVDRKGKKLGEHVASLALESGLGIAVALDDGRTGRFYYAGTRQPLRVDMARGYAEPMREVTPGGGIRSDGRGELQLGAQRFVTPGPVQAIAQVDDRPCVLDDARQLSCFDAKLERAAVVAKDVVALDPHANALTARGEVLALERVDGEVTARRREGLPTMAQLAGPCGRSVDGEIWCWGTVEQLPGSPHQLEARPVELADPLFEASASSPAGAGAAGPSARRVAPVDRRLRVVEPPRRGGARVGARRWRSAPVDARGGASPARATRRIARAPGAGRAPATDPRRGAPRPYGSPSEHRTIPHASTG